MFKISVTKIWVGSSPNCFLSVILFTLSFFIEVLREDFFVDFWQHSHNKRKDSIKTRAKRAVLRVYVENQAILETILLYRASEYKDTERQGY